MSTGNLTSFRMSSRDQDFRDVIESAITTILNAIQIVTTYGFLPLAAGDFLFDFFDGAGEDVGPGVDEKAFEVLAFARAFDL